MPMYTFQCMTCEAELDTFLSINVEVAEYPSCPECGRAMRRCISGIPAHSLKGTGWSQDSYSCTDMGARSVSDQADRKGSVKSFAGQTNRGRR